jgi:hypothetical protein
MDTFRMLSYSILHLLESIVGQVLTKLNDYSTNSSDLDQKMIKKGSIALAHDLIDSMSSNWVILLSKILHIIFDQITLFQKMEETYIIDEVKNCKVNSWEFYQNKNLIINNLQDPMEDDVYSEVSNLDSDESIDGDQDSDWDKNSEKKNIEYRR